MTSNHRPAGTIDTNFKGRGPQYLSLLACPLDGAPLHAAGDAVKCAASPTHHYPVEDGILRLAPADRRGELDALSDAHERRGAAQGWTVPDEAAFKSLPQTGLDGYPENHWLHYADATALLWRFLEAIRRREGKLPVGPMGEAAVIGAGMGWLAYGLDVAGFTTVALDAHAGPRYGLGVYPIARYFRVQADVRQPPLASSAFDLVLFQEGLAGSENAQRAAFERALDALRPGGWVAVMNALPLPDDDSETVQTLLADAGLELLGAPRRRGWRAMLLTLRDRLAGRPTLAPPVLVAQKPA
jgi:SAM-dependent methyltransferase